MKGRPTTKVTVNCLECNEQFKVYQCREKTAKYCSHKCYEVASLGRHSSNLGKQIHSIEERQRRSLIMKGINNPMFGKCHTELSKMKMSGKRPDVTPWNKGKAFPGLFKDSDRTGKNNAYVKYILIQENISYEEYLEKIPHKRQYYRLVRNITNLQPFSLLENYHKRGKSGIEGAYHLDHIYPISKGFENKIPPEIIGDISNLKFIPWLENAKKSNKLI